MRVCFIDTFALDYTIGSTQTRPLGGTQSALCYLAPKLFSCGVDVTAITNTSRPGFYSGVRCFNLEQATAHVLRDSDFDFVVLLNDPLPAEKLRSDLPAHAKLLLWNHHAPDQRQIQPLRRKETQDAFDRIVFVSNYQRLRTEKEFGVDPAKSVVLGNGIADAFLNMFSSPSDLIGAKLLDPALAYTSTPFRGLEHLAKMWPGIHSKFPRATLSVYSSMDVYKTRSPYGDIYAALYQTLKRLPGVFYVGSLPQPDLARALRPMNILAYPNTFAENQSIAVLEALAVGLIVLTSDYGGMREGTFGHAKLVPYAGQEDIPSPQYIEAYVAALEDLLTDFSIIDHAPSLFAQAQDISERCSWATRAKEWENFLTALA